MPSHLSLLFFSATDDQEFSCEVVKDSVGGSKAVTPHSPKVLNVAEWW